MPSFHSPCLLPAAAALLCGAALVGTASAQGVDVSELQRIPAVRAAISACVADRDRLCSSVTPGGGRIVRCLAARSEALSPGCRTAMEKASSALISAGVALTPDQPTK